MRSIAIAVAFLGGLAVGYFAWTSMGSFQQRGAHSADLTAIERLHQADLEATLQQDPVYLDQLWSDDCIKVDGPNGPVVGLKAMKEMYAKFKADYPGFKVLRYVPDYKSAQIAIVDGWAIEVGYVEATYQMSAKESPVSVPRTQGMRLLKRQSDGSWKFAVVGLK
ncbi:MAG TPA: nuclear transport factor 2 family protein [Candidatus Cybelea sp.]|nr:nuclear transport factor 2 family protein [Candidatus Cybelea sp.]